MLWPFLLSLLAFGAGIFLVITTVLAAIRSFVLPRNESVRINNWVFRAVRYAFSGLARLRRTYAGRDQLMALYAPVGLVALPIVWLALVSVGYTLLFWAIGEGNLERSFRISNSSLLTLGSEEPSGVFFGTILSYSEATLGLLLITLLISYLPTMYQAFSRREVVVARLELRAGAPASVVTLVEWLHQTEALDGHGPQWELWEAWFVEIEETHTSLAILAFFRSPQPGRSWVTAATIILDTAVLISSTVNQPRNPHLDICLKAGCIALNRVHRYFEKSDAEPAPLPESRTGTDPARADYNKAYQQLQELGLTLCPAEESWVKYQELRSRYHTAAQYLAKLTMAPDVKAL